jgi:RNA polymerase sigma factor (sigma-70 family)
MMDADEKASDLRQVSAEPSQTAQGDLHSRSGDLYREHNEALIRAVYSRLHSWDEAKEVVQEAYVRVFRLGASVEGSRPINFLRAYLYKTAFNIAADRIREKVVRRRDHHLVCAEVEQNSASAERLYLEEEFRACLQTAVNGLPPKRRMAYTLVELQGQTVRQASAQMGTTEMAVYQLINRAYADLARELVAKGWHK